MPVHQDTSEGTLCYYVEYTTGTASSYLLLLFCLCLCLCFCYWVPHHALDTLPSSHLIPPPPPPKGLTQWGSRVEYSILFIYSTWHAHTHARYILHSPTYIHTLVHIHRRRLPYCLQVRTLARLNGSAAATDYSPATQD